MNMQLDLEKNLMQIGDIVVPFLVVENMIWFKGIVVAQFLGYKDTAGAIFKKVKEKHKKTYEDLVMAKMATPDYNTAKTKWINEPGLYSLIMSSKLPVADQFQDWVIEEVLPQIRKTGQYQVQKETVPHVLDWHQVRIKGIESFKDKNASLKGLITNRFGAEMYAIVNNMINRAVIGYDITTSRYKKERGIKTSTSIPSLLDTRGLTARDFAEGSFKVFIEDNQEAFRSLNRDAIIQRFDEHREILRKSFQATGYGHLESRMLTESEAKRSNKESRQLKKMLVN